MKFFNSNRYVSWMTPTKKRHRIIAILCFIALIAYPFESNLLPVWRLQIVDVNENVCRNMLITQSWGHYSLYPKSGSGGLDKRFTDINGYVEFPERKIRASLLRRVFMPVISYILTIAHGGGGVDGAVWATGIKDWGWLSYKAGKPLPDKMRVEKCISGDT
jgi:hypothetical protein